MGSSLIGYILITSIYVIFWFISFFDFRKKKEIGSNASESNEIIRNYIPQIINVVFENKNLDTYVNEIADFSINYKNYLSAINSSDEMDDTKIEIVAFDSINFSILEKIPI